jgi:hypothetical protein
MLLRQQNFPGLLISTVQYPGQLRLASLNLQRVTSKPEGQHVVVDGTLLWGCDSPRSFEGWRVSSTLRCCRILQHRHGQKPFRVALGTDGNLYVVDNGNSRQLRPRQEQSLKLPLLLAEAGLAGFRDHRALHFDSFKLPLCDR